MQSCSSRVFLTQWSTHSLPDGRSGARAGMVAVGGCAPLRVPSLPARHMHPGDQAQSAARRGPHPQPSAPCRPLLPPAGQASIKAPERPPSGFLRAPPPSSLGLPHLHSPGSRLLGKVTSAHSTARGFHTTEGDTAAAAAGKGRGGASRDGWAGGQRRWLQGRERQASWAAAGRALCGGIQRDSDGI